MVDLNSHNRGVGSGAQYNQGLPSFSIFLRLSAQDITGPMAPAERPSSSMVRAPGPPGPPATGASNTSRYPEMPSPTSAGDKFRNWFPETEVKQGSGTVQTDAWSKKSTASTASLDPDHMKLRSALLAGTVEQGCPSRRTSLPSISDLTSQESHDAEHHHNLWRRASTSNTFTGNSLLPAPNPRGMAMLPPASDLKLLPVCAPGTIGSHVLPTRPAPSDQKPSAPSPPPPSPATLSTQRRDSDSESRLSDSLRASRKKKSRSRAQIERVDSDRVRYKCPFEGCGLLYTWKENLARHNTTCHDAMATPRRCPFCEVNAERLSFNRIDNFKEHILRHTREEDNGRIRTRFHPDAPRFYQRLMDESRGDRRRGNGRVRRRSLRTAGIIGTR